jgi:hypothetical protein
MMQVVNHILSILTHPLLIVSYGYLLMTALNPFLFGQSAVLSKNPFLLILLFSTFLIPLIAVSLMKVLGLVKDFQMKKKEERIGPIFTAAVLYAAFYFNVSRSNDIPLPYLTFLLGALISLFMSLLVILFEKISMHASGLAGLTMAIAVFYFSDYGNSLIISSDSYSYSIHILAIVIILLLISGLVGSLRVLSQAHSTREVYMGYFVGILGQVGAIMIYG